MKTRPRRVPRRAAAGRRAGRESGYNMVILVVAVTILNIMLAMALPAWSHLIRRDKEEELRSRGLQYAEAIRVFQMRYGRLPVRLEELIEVKPRSIRRLWTEPLAADGKWGILFLDVPAGGEGPEQDPGNPGLKRVTIGPIVGVHSKSKEASLSTFFGAASYEQWRFTVDLLQRTPFRPDAQFPRLDLRNLGRPFGHGLEIAFAQPGDALMGAGQNLAGGGVPGQFGQPGGAQPGRPAAGRPGFPSGEQGFPPGGEFGDPGGEFGDPGGEFGDPGGGKPERPGGSFPGFPGGEDPGGGPPGGTPPTGAPGFDPTVPVNGSASSFLPSRGLP